MNDQIWQRTRNELLKAYEDSGAAYYCFTRPYKSAQPFVWEIVSPVPAGAATMAYAVLNRGQKVNWFDYGEGEAMSWAPGTTNPTKIATASDTNLSRGRQTNGTEDFVIESISASCKGSRIAYAAGTTTSTDVDVINAFIGNFEVRDPGALMAPPQFDSPFNLEGVLFEAIKPVCAISFLWDQKNLLKIGTLDEIPEGGAKSFLHASGDPRTDNRYKVPEGYAWRKQGLKDCDFVVVGEITDTIVVPITLVTTDGAGAARVPELFYTDVVVRLHGMAIDGVTRNV